MDLEISNSYVMKGGMAFESLYFQNLSKVLPDSNLAGRTLESYAIKWYEWKAPFIFAAKFGMLPAERIKLY